MFQIALAPVHNKWCLICMKYRIIILIIIIISLGEFLLSHIANPYRKHARRACTGARARTHIHAHTLAHTRTQARGFSRTRARTHTTRWRRSGSMSRWRPSVTKLTHPFRLFRWHAWPGSWVIQINPRAADQISPRFWMFFASKKLLGRTKTRTRDRMYCQSIRTV